MHGFYRVTSTFLSGVLLLGVAACDSDPEPQVNQPPTLQLALGPQLPTTLDALSVTATVSDPNGDQVELTYAWTKDGESTASSTAMIEASATERGQKWVVTVTASDGKAEAEPVTAEVTIQNAPPLLDSVTLSPTAGLSSDTFVATAGATSDPDNDTVTVRFRFEADGQVVQEGFESELAPGSIRRGQALTVVAIPTDGTDDGPAVTSAAATVANSPPVLAGAQINPAVGDAGTVFTCLALGWADLDGDPEQYRYQWLIRGVITTITTATVSAPDIAKGYGIQCDITPHDGIADGMPRRSTTITVQNALPVLSGVEIAPESPTEADTITATLGTWSDADGDRPGYDYLWWVNGRVASTRRTLSPDSFNKDDQVYLRVTPKDGDDSGLPVTSSTITVANTLPVVATVRIEPATPASSDTIVGIPEGWSDPDPADMPNYRFAWFANGSVIPGASAAQLLPGSVARGDILRLDVTPVDTSGSGLTVSSPTTTVINSPPSAPLVAIQPASPALTDNLTCVITTPSIDLDGDSVTYRYGWMRNGQATTVTSSVVDAARTSDRETWRCVVTAFDGTESGAPGVVEVQLGTLCTTLAFDGVDDRVSVAAATNVRYGPQATVEAWVRWDGVVRAGAQGNIFTHRPASEALSLGVFQTDTSGCECPGHVAGQPYLRLAGGCSVDSCLRDTQPLTPNRWHHVAGVVDGSNATLYINGRPVATTTAAVALATLGASPAVGIGARSDGSGGFFSGQIGSVRVSQTARYTGEFRPLRRLGLEAETTALWALDEGSGTMVAEALGAGTGQLVGPTWSGEAPVCEFDPVGVAEGLAVAFCAHRSRCEFAFEGFLGQDQQTCITEQSTFLTARYTALAQMISSDRVRFNETAYDSCLAAYASADCEVGQEVGFCDFLLGQQPVNQACSDNSECITGAYCDATGTNLCATCRAQAIAPQPCDTVPCADGTQCLNVGAQRLCIPFTATVGAPCGTVTSGLCRGRLQCVVGSGICERPAAPGAACDPQGQTRASCNIYVDQGCDAGICRDISWVGVGQTCDAVNACTVQGNCAGGRCGARPSSGQACGTNGLCAQNHYCDTSNVCRADLLQGQACTGNGRCEAGLFCEAGICQSFRWSRCQ